MARLLIFRIKWKKNKGLSLPSCLLTMLGLDWMAVLCIPWKGIGRPHPSSIGFYIPLLAAITCFGLSSISTLPFDLSDSEDLLESTLLPRTVALPQAKLKVLEGP